MLRPIPAPSYCRCGRRKAAPAPLCHRCTGLAWHAAHPLPAAGPGGCPAARPDLVLGPQVGRYDRYRLVNGGAA